MPPDMKRISKRKEVLSFIKAGRNSREITRFTGMLFVYAILIKHFHNRFILHSRKTGTEKYITLFVSLLFTKKKSRLFLMEIEHFTYLSNLIYGAYILMHKQ